MEPANESLPVINLLIKNVSIEAIKRQLKALANNLLLKFSNYPPS